MNAPVWKHYECSRCYDVAILSLHGRPECRICKKRLIIIDWVM